MLASALWELNGGKKRAQQAECGGVAQGCDEGPRDEDARDGPGVPAPVPWPALWLRLLCGGALPGVTALTPKPDTHTPISLPGHNLVGSPEHP